jgi:heme exporter protein CcmD
MTDFIHWLRLDGFAVYVWPAYACTALAVVLNVAWARRSARAARVAARRRLAAQREAGR